MGEFYFVYMYRTSEGWVDHLIRPTQSRAATIMYDMYYKARDDTTWEVYGLIRVGGKVLTAE